MKVLLIRRIKDIKDMFSVKNYFSIMTFKATKRFISSMVVRELTWSSVHLPPLSFWRTDKTRIVGSNNSSVEGNANIEVNRGHGT